ncbi:MAG: DmsE family decaheme c-type cytochrome, partial [Gammaproteobacteria bacterium]|nr:DmsE family decaheme c-type cytochrome [Gammaproteobacteria bacterium]
NRDVVCTSCHKIHSSHDKTRDKREQTEICFNCHKQQRSQLHRPSHHPVLEGEMACSDCHNVHGDNPMQLVKASTNETCYTCHMEKRGPFLHNHQPVAEDCGICHSAHGTITDNLLKYRQPYLCQGCHSHTRHPTSSPSLVTAPGSGRNIPQGRGCVNCHTNIHGSNSTQNATPGTRFVR